MPDPRRRYRLYVLAATLPKAGSRNHVIAGKIKGGAFKTLCGQSGTVDTRYAGDMRRESISCQRCRKAMA